MYPQLQQVYWYSGVYLQPQHLQSLDLYHDFMLSRQRQRAQPWNIGIIRCEFNEDTLSDFSLRIESLQAVLPSGDYLEYPGNCVLPPRQLRGIWKQTENPLTLWLALRRFDPGHPNVGDSPNSRWVSPHDISLMKDVYFTGPECEVSRIVYNVQILSEEEKNRAVDCECIPFLRIRCDNERIVPDPSFCPPVITLNGSPTLKALLEGMVAELSARAHQFEEYRRGNQTKHTSQFDMVPLLALQALNRTLPLLHHYCGTPALHPWTIYGLLVQLIGELSTFSDRCSFAGRWEDETQSLLPYDHFDLCSSFSSAKKVVMALLNNLRPDDNTWIALNPDQRNIFRGDLNELPREKGKRNMLMLRSESLVGRRDIDCADFKLAPASMMESFIQHALPGIATSPLDSAPPGVPDRRDTCYFLLNEQDQLWKIAEQEQGIAFYWDSASADLTVQLIAIEDI